MILGYTQALLYILVITISSLMVSHLGSDDVPISLMLLISSIMCVVIYSLCNIKLAIQAHKTIFKSFYLWLILSLSTVAVWYFTYVTIIYSTERFQFTIFPLVLALCGSIIDKDRFKLIVIVPVLVGIYMIMPETSLITIISSLLAGLSGFIFLKTSTIYADKHQLNALQVLSIRFYLLILCSFILLMVSDIEIVFHLGQSISLKLLIVELMIIGFLNMVIPNFLVQASVLNLGAEKLSYIVTLIPVVAYSVEGIIDHDWNILVLIICIAVSIVLNWNIFRKTKLG